MWKKGEFSKAVVTYCIRWMTAVLVWAVVLTTIATFLDKQIYLTEVLSFASAFFGGELLLLCLKRILAKERGTDDESIPDNQCPDFGTECDPDSVCDSVGSEQV